MLDGASLARGRATLGGVAAGAEGWVRIGKWPRGRGGGATGRWTANAERSAAVFQRHLNESFFRN
jgi:hypothetical protein